MKWSQGEGTTGRFWKSSILDSGGGNFDAPKTYYQGHILDHFDD